MSTEHAITASPVVVQRWKRYGHDRAYVRIDDLQLGYRDLLTGTVHCERPEFAETVTRATDAMVALAASQAYVPRHSAVDDVSADTPPAPLLPDRDLALNLPGQAVRQVATELRDAAPVRTLLQRMVGAKTDERAHRIGADGEVEVARRLDRLGPQWRVLHAVPVGDRGSDIDHVVIGPGGVFTINAKNHPRANVWVAGDTVKINGHNQPYVRNSRHEAQRAARLLTDAAGFDVEVRGIVAVMGAHNGFTVREQPRDGRVRVTTRKEVDGFLRSRPEVLGLPSVERIYDVARHLSTWQPRTVGRQDF